MNIVSTVGKLFRSASKDKSITVGKYDILSPLMNVQEYAEKTKELLELMSKDTAVVDLLNGHSKEVKNKITSEAIKANDDFVKGLHSEFRRKASTDSFGVMIDGLNSILKNLELVESHFPTLFGAEDGEIDEDNLRTSSLVLLGYIETVSEFCTWVGVLIKHLTPIDHDLIPPFETKSLILKADHFGGFVGFNLTQWTSENNGILSTVTSMQKKGVDVTIKAGDAWIDSFIHDSQFTPIEQELISASLRHPVLFIIDKVVAIKSWWLELNVAHKDWIVAKIALESERLRGMDQTSAEYKRLEKATETYANMAAKLEQKIERLRA